MVFPSNREKDHEVTLKILWPELKMARPENRHTSPTEDFQINYEERCLPGSRGGGGGGGASSPFSCGLCLPEHSRPRWKRGDFTVERPQPGDQVQLGV